MYRAKYIRLFVSSTFEDMEVERNTLQDRVFPNISDYCREKGWQFEAIDLRWGIREEASYDQRTMQICLGELKRCQEISPQPNFLILCGERYGWIPLPELLDSLIADDIFRMASSEELSLFHQWYRLDLNALPNGKYVLQPRDNEYRNFAFYSNTVEVSLRKLFARYVATIDDEEMRISLYGSATEQEIYHGAFKVDNSEEQVVAYLRTLRDIPLYKESTFKQTDKERLDILRARIKDNVSKKNLFDSNIDYKYYCSEDYVTHFSYRMEALIKEIVADEIKKHSKVSELENEIEYHRAFGKKVRCNFIGREKELAEIDNYIKSNSRRPLVIRGASGIGKSALMAQVAAEYNKDYDVVCRFGGVSPQSTDGFSLLESIWMELEMHYSINQFNMPTSLTSNDSGLNCDYLFSLKLKTIKVNKPLIILIDGLDCLNNSNIEWFYSLNWLEQDLANNVHLCLSVDKISKYQIKDMLEVLDINSPIDYAFNIFINKLHSIGRTLNDNLKKYIAQHISIHNYTPLYLTMLATYIGKHKSYDTIAKIPDNVESLYDQLIYNLTLNSNHGCDVVQICLGALRLDRNGFSYNELIDLMAYDDDLYHNISQEQFHKWHSKRRTVPPILWTRLYNDISADIVNLKTPIGVTLRISNSQLSDAIIRHLKDNGIRRTFHAIKKYFYSKGVLSCNHAIYELPYVLFHLREYNDLIDILYNIDFLSKKNYLYYECLLYDLELSISKKVADITLEHKSNLRSIQMFIVEYARCNQTTFRQKIDQLSDNSFLRNSIKRLTADNLWLTNRVCLFLSHRAIVSKGDKRRICHGNMHISFIDQDKIFLYNLETCEYDYEVDCKDSIVDYCISSNLKRLVVLYKNSFSLIDIDKDKVLSTIYCIENHYPLSVKISSNGSCITYSGQNGSALYLDDKNEMNPINCPGIICSTNFSFDGNFMWYSIKKQISRYDINSGMYIDLQIDFESLSDEFITEILSCTETCCALKIIDAELNKKYHSTYYSYLLILNYSEINNSFCYTVSAGMFNACKIGIDNISVLSYMHDEYIRFTSINDYLFQNTPMTKYRAPRIEDCSNDLSVLLSGDRLIRFKSLEGNQFSFYGTNAGCNSISSVADGERIVLSYGKNPIFDEEIYVHILDFKEESHHSCIKLPVDNKEYISGFIVSSDGVNHIAGSLGHIFIFDGNCKLLKTINGEMTEKYTAHCFSQCGKYGLSSNGAYMADITLENLYLYSIEGSYLRKYNFSKQDNLPVIRYNISLLNNGQFVILKGDLYFSILDLNSGKLTSFEYSEVNVSMNKRWFSYSENIFTTCVFPDHRTILFNTENGYSILNYIEEKIEKHDGDLIIAGCSPSGRDMFYINYRQNNTLVKIHNGVQTILMGEVGYIVSAFDDRHIFIMTIDCRVILYDFKLCKSIQSYNLETAPMRHQVTARGIVLVDTLSQVSILEPTEYIIHETVYVTVARPWNVELQTYEPHIAYCPACAAKIVPPPEMVEILHEGSSYLNLSLSVWNNPLLYNHSCSNCGRNIIFNPFIISTICK